MLPARVVNISRSPIKINYPSILGECSTPHTDAVRPASDSGHTGPVIVRIYCICVGRLERQRERERERAQEQARTMASEGHPSVTLWPCVCTRLCAPSLSYYRTVGRTRDGTRCIAPTGALTASACANDTFYHSTYQHSESAHAAFAAARPQRCPRLMERGACMAQRGRGHTHTRARRMILNLDVFSSLAA